MARLDKGETRKDVIQAAVESGATHAGQIMGIVAGAVRDVTREIGEFATDVFEMREAAERAAADAAATEAPVGGPEPVHPEAVETDAPAPVAPDEPAATAEPADPGQATPPPPARNA